jgi:hypothetical protein
MRRRGLLTWVLGLAASSVMPSAAQFTRRARVGWLSGGPAGLSENPLDVLKQTLHELGWRLGETMDMVERHAAGEAARIPRLAAELIAYPRCTLAQLTTWTK